MCKMLFWCTKCYFGVQHVIWIFKMLFGCTVQNAIWLYCTKCNFDRVGNSLISFSSDWLLIYEWKSDSLMKKSKFPTLNFDAQIVLSHLDGLRFTGSISLFGFMSRGSNSLFGFMSRGSNSLLGFCLNVSLSSMVSEASCRCNNKPISYQVSKVNGKPWLLICFNV